VYPSLNRTLVAGKSVDWHQLCALAYYHGFPGVDVDLNPAMKEGASATKDLLASRALRPAVVGCPVNFREDQAKFDEGMQTLPQAAAFAATIGCPRMTTWVHSSWAAPKAETWALLRTRFTAIARVLAEHNVRFGLEYLGPVHLRKANPHPFAHSIKDFLQLATECGPNVGILLDTWHWHHAPDTLADIVAAGKERIVHVQVADAPQLPPEQIVDSERLYAGEGIADLKGVFQTLRKIGYEDGVSPEIFGRGIKDMPLDQAVQMGYETTAQAIRLGRPVI